LLPDVHLLVQVQPVTLYNGDAFIHGLGVFTSLFFTNVYNITGVEISTAGSIVLYVVWRYPDHCGCGGQVGSTQNSDYSNLTISISLKSYNKVSFNVPRF
jgi:hypothetical protein